MNKFKTMLTHALKNEYAIGAFNFINMEGLNAIVKTAKEQNSPVIAAVSEGALKYMSDTFVRAFVKAIHDEYDNVCFHLDHGKSFESCKRAISLGFDSVMIDLSSLPFEENVKGVKEVVDYAHSLNVGVEAELGTLSGVEDEVSVEEGNAKYTNPAQVKEFYERTNCDALAIAIGTSHGAFKFAGEPRLEFAILEEIETLVPDLPLVLHGASSVDQDQIETINTYGGTIEGAKGVPEDLLSKACKHHICKINTDSDLRIAFVAATRKILTENTKLTDPRDILKAASANQCEVLKRKMNVFGSSNKLEN